MQYAGWAQTHILGLLLKEALLDRGCVCDEVQGAEPQREALWSGPTCGSSQPGGGSCKPPQGQERLAVALGLARHSWKTAMQWRGCLGPSPLCSRCCCPGPQGEGLTSALSSISLPGSLAPV